MKEEQEYMILMQKDGEFLDKELHFGTCSQAHYYMTQNAYDLCETPYTFYTIRKGQETSSLPDIFWKFVPDCLLEKIDKQVDLPLGEFKVIDRENGINSSFFKDRIWWGLGEIPEPHYEDEDYEWEERYGMAAET